MYDRILVPVDGSECSSRALEEAARLAKTLHAKVKLIHVVNELILDGSAMTAVGYDALITGLREGGKQILENAVRAAKGADIEPESQLLEAIGGRAAHMIVDEARRWRADLIVMGTHGRRGIVRLAMGSDAELVLRHSPVPVLVVRPAEG
jgi:nucleotide-binding universal stress UspA family protein